MTTGGKIVVVEYDPSWPGIFVKEAARIRFVMGHRALQLEHVGSTAVPGLVAKPVIDLLLVVDDSGNENAYLPLLEQAGYSMKIREPDWYQHRLLKGPDTDINLHVLSDGCPEIDRMLLFRDWLRAHAEDRDSYAATKLALARQEWKSVQDYADAKTAVVAEIISRATSRSGVPVSNLGE